MNTIQQVPINCVDCSDPYPNDSTPHVCRRCGDIFDFPQDFEFTDLHAVAKDISLGEGNTPLIWIKKYKKKVGLKLEFLNPTGSFKDRGTALMVSFLKSRGVTEAIEDSSGNAGASFAAYAARAGIKARVFVPSYASGPKMRQIEAYGAELVIVEGNRAQTTEALIGQVNGDVVYASHAHLPHGIPGFATIAYELIKQMEGLPGTIIAPAGQGTLLLGIGRGFGSLKKAGIIASVPILIGVQSRNIAPFVKVLPFGDNIRAVYDGDGSLAEGVSIANPVRMDAVKEVVASSGGGFVPIDEKDIRRGVTELAQRGFYVEPTSAIVWAALEQNIDRLAEPIILVLTGSGLKSSR